MKRKALKATALTLAIQFLTTALAPTLSYALTAGPTAPEYTSFEPVDTTDMVNLATGDFTYNIPLLEVPGPEGGYPLALSYHAGIMPDEEVSWVGLGWSLNAGAINRSVNNYPDDVFGSQSTVRDFWPGGESNSFTLGVGISVASVDITIANDTYKGAGIGVSASGGPNYQFGQLQVGVQASVGISPYGDVTVGVQGDAGVKLDENTRIGISNGVSTNFKSINVSGGIGLSSSSLGGSIIGANISSQNLKPSVSLVGVSGYFNNSNAGKISSQSGSFGITIPIYVGNINLSSSYYRYWSDEKDDLLMYGSLHANQSSKNPRNSSIDSYLLPEFESTDGDLNNFDSYINSSENQQGGSFLATDNFTVVGQGIGGSIEPFYPQNTNTFRKITTKTITNGDQSISITPYFYGISSEDDTRKVNFRFKNDFSNKFLVTPNTYPDFSFISDKFTSILVNPIFFPPSTLFSIPMLNFTNQYDPSYYNFAQNKLAGSRHVEWVTNGEIKNGTFTRSSSIIPHEGASFGDRPTTLYGRSVDNQVGGFVVTNTSGVSYHYTLPAYAYGEYSKMTMNDGSFREYSNSQPYAYTWLLTAITGPDYVDRGAFGITDDDFGYWVQFNYGKWTDSYQYRTPFEGTTTDINEGIKKFTKGFKELYYLNYIHTRSHTAIFEKDIRLDGKGAELQPTFSNYINNSFSPFLSSSSLKLNNIYLFNNDDLIKLLQTNNLASLNELANRSNNTKYTNAKLSVFTYSPTKQNPQWPADYLLIGFDTKEFNVPIKHFWNNVIDYSDLNSLNGFSEKIVRKIQFNTSYDLCKGSNNNVESNDGYYNDVRARVYGGINSAGGPIEYDGRFDLWEQNYHENGKLTLNSVELRGKGGAAIMPPTVFHYNYSNSNGSYPEITTDAFHNPPYSKDSYDIWGNYKPDIIADQLQKNETLARQVSETSASYAGAWSLKEIETSLGAKIKVEYESDSYTNTAITSKENLPISSIEYIDNSTFKVNINGQYNLHQLLDPIANVGGTIRLIGASRYFSSDRSGNYWCQDIEENNNSIMKNKFWQWLNFNRDFSLNSVSDIGNSHIIVHSTSPITGEELNSLATGVNNPVHMTCKCIYEKGGGKTDLEATYIFSEAKLVAGNVFFTGSQVKKGGGHRVSKVSVVAADGIYTTHYNYENGNTSYVPNGFGNNFQLGGFYANDDEKNRAPIWKRNENFSYYKYSGAIAQYFNNVLTYARELPPPGVFYEKVTVNESVSDANGANAKAKPGTKVFNFRPFKFGGINSDVQRVAGTNNTGKFSPRAGFVTFKDFTSRVGNLVSTIEYGVDGNPLEKTTYQYVYNDVSGDELSNDSYIDQMNNNYNQQGRIEQVFNECRIFTASAPDNYIFTYSKKENFPSILKKTTVVNYKTGVTNTVENLAYDFITGEATKTKTTDSYGNTIITETTPAYKINDYNSMGIKIFNDYQNSATLGKNMLSQTAKTVVYKADVNNNPVGLLSANVQTWNSTSYPNTFTGQNIVQSAPYTNVWRPLKNYQWIGTDQLQPDGTHTWQAFLADPFIYWLASQEAPANSYWQKNSEITLYDSYSHVLESSDLNGQYSAARLDPRSLRTVATSAPAKISEMTYSGAEYFTGNTNTLDNGVSKANGIPSTSFAHTGLQSLQVPASGKGFVYTLKGADLNPAKKYWASVWVYMPGSTENTLTDAQLYYKVNGITYTASPQQANKAGDKYLINLKITPSGQNDIEIGCFNNSNRDIYFDDFRLHPLGASMNAYVYDPVSFETIAVLDNDNLYTRYVYDDAGKLKAIYKELFAPVEKKISTQRYNYSKNY